jgi:hypothetical protein
MHAARLSLAAIALLSLSLVAGCGDSASQSKADDEMTDAQQRELGRDTDQTVFDDMIQTQDKARAVEDLTLGRKDDLDRALDSASGDDPPADQ